MVKISVKNNIDEVMRQFKAEASQIPFATAVALTRIAHFAAKATKKHLTDVFDRPKPSTKDSIVVDKATKTELTAVVRHKTRDAGGVPSDEFLTHNIIGGPRIDKRSEVLLRVAGILPEGMQTVPGQGARLDSFGNMSRGQIVQILSYFKAFGGIKSSGRGYAGGTRSKAINRTKKYQRGAGYFVVTAWDTKQRLYPGVWKVDKAGIDLILVFVKSQMKYKSKYYFAETTEKAAVDRFSQEFQRAMREAIRTAR